MKTDFLLLGLVILTGCATIVKGTSQTIAISTPPVAGANCKINNGDGLWYVITPGTVTVPKSNDALMMQCVKPDYAESNGAINAKVEPWVLGNILIGGIIGLVVDIATGALHTYPNDYALPMYADRR